MKTAKGFGGIFALTIAAIAILAVGQSGLSASPDNQSMSPTEIKIDNFSFTPQTLTVPAGTTVIWKNNDDVPHTVVSTNKIFKSPALDTDESYSFTFTKPGTYTYFCSVHPKMTATIVVQ